MAEADTDYREPNDAEVQRQAEICCETWVGDPAQRVAEQKALGGDGRWRVVVRGGEVAAGLTALHVTHWFGGKALPAWAIAAVAVAPRFRGSGAGSALMRGMIREAYGEGVALSTLYPATSRFYRGLGYEYGGEWLTWEMGHDAMAALRSETCEMTPINMDDTRPVQELHRRYAEASAGVLGRSAYFWQRKLKPSGEYVSGYIVRFDGQAEGYVLINQNREPGYLVATDVVALTDRAARAILGFAGRANRRGFLWVGGAGDPLALTPGEMRATVRSREPWMSRVIHVERALEGRGYAPLDAELHLDITDPVIEANNGRYVLALEDGQPRVERGGGGLVRCDVRGLSAMFTGHLSPLELRAMGVMSGDPSQLALASAIFAGPRPWMNDRF